MNKAILCKIFRDLVKFIPSGSQRDEDIRDGGVRRGRGTFGSRSWWISSTFPGSGEAATSGEVSGDRRRPARAARDGEVRPPTRRCGDGGAARRHAGEGTGDTAAAERRRQEARGSAGARGRRRGRSGPGGPAAGSLGHGRGDGAGSHMAGAGWTGRRRGCVPPSADISDGAEEEEARVRCGFIRDFGGEGHIYRFWELGESK